MRAEDRYALERGIHDLLSRDPSWLPWLWACLDYGEGRFCSKWIAQTLGAPATRSFRPLVARRILVRLDDSPGERQAYYRLEDPVELKQVMEDLVGSRHSMRGRQGKRKRSK